MAQHKTLRTFYILIATQVFSLIGSQMTQLAIGIWVYAETGNATPLALAAFFGAIPNIVMSSVAGVLADRWDRRWVMVLADGGQAVGTLLLLISFASGAFQLWHLYVISVFSSMFGVFQGPAFMAAVTMLVPDEQRDRANALQQVTGPAAIIVAPALAGMLFALIDAPGVMAIDLGTFLVAILVVALVDIPRPAQTAEGRAAQGSVWKESWVGLRFLWERRPLFLLRINFLMINFFFGITAVLLTPYVLSRTDSEATLGLLMSMMGMGGLAGGIIMSVWGGTRPRIHTILPGIAIMGIFFALFGMARSPLLMGLALVGLTVPMPMVNASSRGMLQIKTPPDMQGRVFATVAQLAMLMTPLAYLLAGPLADQVFEPAVGGAGWSMAEPLVGTGAGAGMGLMAMISGMLIAVTAVVFYAMPVMRHMEATLPDYAAVAAAETAAVTAEQAAVPAAPTPASAR